jgi:hypothetical protein
VLAAGSWLYLTLTHEDALLALDLTTLEGGPRTMGPAPKASIKPDRLASDIGSSAME